MQGLYFISIIHSMARFSSESTKELNTFSWTVMTLTRSLQIIFIRNVNYSKQKKMSWILALNRSNHIRILLWADKSNNRFHIIVNEHWKIQIKQITNDGQNCQQQFIYDGSILWSDDLICPDAMTDSLNIYFSGSDTRIVSGAVRNFEFTTFQL